MSVFFFCVLFFSCLDSFFSQFFTNFRLSRLTFISLLILSLLLITTNYCHIVTLTNLLLHARLLLLFNKLYCIVLYCSVTSVDVSVFQNEVINYK